MRTLIKSFSVLGLVALSSSLVGCAPPPAEEAKPAVYDPGVFTFAPVQGAKHQHVMKRLEQVEIVGTSYLNSEEWEATWNVEISSESNVTVLLAELAALKLSVNGQELLQGDEVNGLGGKMELLFDSKGKVVDIRKTQTVTDAVTKAVPEEMKAAVASLFSAESIKMLFVHRANERMRDLVGKSARVGSVWGAQSGHDGKGPVVKELEVKAIEDCGADKCVRVDRQFTVEKEAVWEMAKNRVAAYVTEKGGDPSQVELTAADIEVKDSMLVNPHTMEFHDASFNHNSGLSVKTPDGELSVKFVSLRTSTYTR